jgi:hypothetical protein
MFSGRMEADERPVYEYLEFGCGYERGIHQNVNKPRLSTQQITREARFYETHIGIAVFHAARFDLFNNEVKLIKDLNRAGGVSSRVLRDVSNSLMAVCRNPSRNYCHGSRRKWFVLCDE